MKGCFVIKWRNKKTGADATWVHSWEEMQPDTRIIYDVGDREVTLEFVPDLEVREDKE